MLRDAVDKSARYEATRRADLYRDRTMTQFSGSGCSSIWRPGPSVHRASRVGVIPLVLLASACDPRSQSAVERLPIIDMHLHSHSLAQYGGGMPNCANDQEIVYPGGDPRQAITFKSVKTCASPMPAAATDELLMKDSLAALERHNI